jgi:hypothetical protein
VIRDRIRIHVAACQIILRTFCFTSVASIVSAGFAAHVPRVVDTAALSHPVPTETMPLFGIHSAQLFIAPLRKLQ